jgi:UDP-glucuronate 4-epimerase
MNVLITGVTGFIGNELFNKLTNYYNVFGLSRSIKTGTKLFCCDLINRNHLKNIFRSGKFDVVIHTAASADFYSSNDSMLYFNNIISTTRLIEACIENKTKRIIFLSSNMVYGKSYRVNTSNFTESNPEDIYAKSKFISELTLKDQSDHLETVILRLPSVLGFGKNTSDVVHDMIKQLKENKNITIYGSGESRRQFIHIDDLIHIVKYFIDNNPPDSFSIFPVASSGTLKIKEIAIKIINHAGYGKSRYLKEKTTPPDQYIDSTILSSITNINPEITLDSYLMFLSKNNYLISN